MAALQDTAEPVAEPGLIEQIATWLASPDDSILMATVGLGIFAGLALLQGILFAGLAALSRGRKETLLFLIKTLVGKMGWIFLAVVSLEISQFAVKVPAGLSVLITKLFTVSAVIQGSTLTFHLIMGLLTRYIAANPDSTISLRNAMGLIQSMVRLTLIVVAIVLVLDNLGVNVTTLIAGVGIGGIAIGLAAQGVFRDLFSSLSIILERPFAVGHFIVAGDLSGTVEQIGLRSTRLRATSGEEIIAPNSDLTASRLRNFEHMTERRVLFDLGVTYDTPHETLARIPDMIRSAVERQERTRFARCHFKAYGDFALTFETAYFVLSSDYETFMDIQQAVNMAIHRDFESAGIAFAFPTQTIHLDPPSRGSAHASGPSTA